MNITLSENLSHKATEKNTIVTKAERGPEGFVFLFLFFNMKEESTCLIVR